MLILTKNPNLEIKETAVKSQGITITSLAVCHNSKTTKSTRQSFFNFQENLNEGK
jgi:hypothetical protein